MDVRETYKINDITAVYEKRILDEYLNPQYPELA